MNVSMNTVGAWVVAGTVLVWSGCGSNTTAPKEGAGKPAAKGHKEGDGHAHEDEAKAGAEHAHPEEGPHHGHLIELGEEEYHAELAHDDKTKTVTIYLLDKEAKKTVAIPDMEIVLNLMVDGTPLQAKLAASPQEGDPEGESSRFTITDETVLEAHDAPKTTGRLRVTIAGKEYNGVVEIKPRAAHKD